MLYTRHLLMDYSGIFLEFINTTNWLVRLRAYHGDRLSIDLSSVFIVRILWWSDVKHLLMQQKKEQNDLVYHRFNKIDDIPKFHIFLAIGHPKSRPAVFMEW